MKGLRLARVISSQESFHQIDSLSFSPGQSDVHPGTCFLGWRRVRTGLDRESRSQLCNAPGLAGVHRTLQVVFLKRQQFTGDGEKLHLLKHCGRHDDQEVEVRVAAGSGPGCESFEAGTFAGGFEMLPSDVVALSNTGAGKISIGPHSQAMEISATIVVGTKGAIAKQDVRQALSLSINRAQSIEAVQHGVGTRAYTSAGPGFFSYEKGIYTAAYNKTAAAYTNETKAHALALKLVKVVRAVAKLPIVLSVIGGLSNEANRAAVVQQSLAAVGLNVKLKVVTGAEYGALFRNPTSRKGIDLVQTLNYDQHADPLALNNGIALPYAISNSGSYFGPAIEKLLTQTNGELNSDKRRAGRPGASARHEEHAVDPTCLQPWRVRRQGRVRCAPRPQSADGPIGRVSWWLLVVTE